MRILTSLNSAMIKKVIIVLMLAIGLIIGSQNVKAQTVKEVKEASSATLLSRLALLSIHVSSVEIHDSVFHFLTDKLGLPVDYYPVMFAGRRYAAVYAGNMFLEPCGPFSTFTYASKDFKAIFFGLNWGSERSLSSVGEEITGKNFKVNKGDVIEVTDSSLIKPNIYFAVACKATLRKLDDSLRTVKRDDSLRTVMQNNNKNRLGIEKIKEVRVGYKDNNGLDKWKELMKPSKLSKDGMWKLQNGPSIHFVKSNLREVNSIVFKVKSLKDAKSYLIDNHLLGNIYKNEIALDKSKTYGLSIFVCEE